MNSSLIRLAKLAFQHAPTSVKTWGANQLPALKEYGKVIDLKFDLKAKSLFAVVHLKGDEKPLEISVDKFELNKGKDSSSVVIGKASSDRAWVDTVIQKHLIGRVLPVSSDAVEMIEGLFES